MIKLYEFAISGNCHKVRLMLSLLNIKYQSIAVDGNAKAQKSEAFLKMNPFGQVPVLTDGEITICDSQAILVYLARKYGNQQWLPTDATQLAEVCGWLSTAANEVATGPARLRVHFKLGRAINIEESRQTTENLLAVIQKRLANNTWLACDHISIADIAIYPYLALAPEGRVDLEPYPAILNWMGRIQALSGYVGMAGMWQPEPLNLSNI
jgi:glutathione S-transferase